MTRRRASAGSSWRRARSGPLAALIASIGTLQSIDAEANVVLDGRVGSAGAGPIAPEQVGTEVRYLIRESDGQRSGNNLFHSFLTLTLGANETAIYQGAPEIRNLITTITGGASSIDGKIVSEIPGANLYLFNPSGITFGENAKVDVTGALRVSTADQVIFANGDRVATGGPAPPAILSVADPVGFGFLGAPAPITVNGSRIGVRTDQEVAFVGGDLTFSGHRTVGSGGLLNVPSGRLDLAALASPGDVLLEAQGIRADGVARWADVRIVDDFVVSTSGLDTASSPFAALFFPPAPGSGPVFVRAHDLLMRDAQLRTQTVTSEDAGDVEIDLSGKLTLEGGALGVQTGIFADTGFNLPRDPSRTLIGFAFKSYPTLGLQVTADICTGGAPCGIQYQNTGRAGDVTVRARDVALLNGGKIAARSEASGNAGTIDIGFLDEMIIAGRRGPDDVSQLSTNSNASRGIPSGNPGRIHVQSQDGRLRLDDHGSIVIQNGVDGSTNPTAGGIIEIDVAELEMRGDARIDSSIRGAGSGGFLDIQARDRISLSGRSSDTSFTGISTLAQPGSTGPAGEIRIATGVLEIRDGAEVASRPADATAQGSGGNIRITVGDRLLMHGGTISTQSSNSAGSNIDLSVGNVAHLVGSTITTSVTTGPENGGNISLLPGPDVLVLDHSQILAQADEGAGGSIDLEAGVVLIDRNSTIDASSRRGVSGEVLINGVEGNIVPDVAELATPTVDASGLLREPCAARRPGASNRFVVDERARVSLDASDYLAAPMGALLAAESRAQDGEARRRSDEGVSGERTAASGVDATGTSEGSSERETLALAQADPIPSSDCAY